MKKFLFVAAVIILLLAITGWSYTTFLEYCPKIGVSSEGCNLFWFIIVIS